MSQKFARIFLIVLVIFHFIGAIGFASKTPYRTAGYLFSQRDPQTGQFASVQDIGAPDERQHANYIGHLLSKKSLPVFDPKSPTLYEDYQSHQPPVYYGVASLVATITGQTDPTTHSFGNVIRGLNAVFGAVGVAGAFFLGIWLTKKDEVGVITATVYALLPMNIALSGAISNDPLLIALLTWGIAFCLKLVDEPALKTLYIASAILCLAPMVKSSGIIGVPILFGSAFIASRKLPQRTIALAVPALLLLVFCGPIWMRNTSLYGDPLAQGAFKQAFGGSAQKSMIIAGIEASNVAGSPEVQYWLNWVGYWTARSFIGVFGYMDIWLNETSRALGSASNLVYKAVIAFHSIGLVGFIVALRNGEQEFRRKALILVGAIALTLIVFAGFNNTYFQAQARYLFPALGAFSAAFAVGWLSIAKKQWLAVLSCFVLIYGGLAIFSFTKLGPEFEARKTGTLPVSSP